MKDAQDNNGCVNEENASLRKKREDCTEKRLRSKRNERQALAKAVSRKTKYWFAVDNLRKNAKLSDTSRERRQQKQKTIVVQEEADAQARDKMRCLS